MGSIEQEIGELRRKCIGCGRCSRACPALEISDLLDPKELMINGEGDLSVCVMCGKCTLACNRTDPFSVIRDMIALEKGLHVSETFKTTGYPIPMVDHPSREELPPAWTGDDVSVMPGCVAKCKVPFLEYACSVAINTVGSTCKELKDAGCCIHQPQFREISDFERKSMKREMGAKAGDSRIVTMCGGCTIELDEAGVKADHISMFLHDNIDKLPKTDKPLKVALQPGCAGQLWLRETKMVVTAMGHDLMLNEFGCCGKNTPLAEEMMAQREEECEGCDVIVVSCPMCWTKYDAQPGGKPVLHLAELVALTAGDDRTLKYHRIPM